MSTPTPPTVVHLKRTKHGVVQDCDVYIGRRVTQGGWKLPQSKWANPWSVASCGGSNEVAVDKYRHWIVNQPELLAAIPTELAGKRLGCWCKPQACHGDVLVELFGQREHVPK